MESLYVEGSIHTPLVSFNTITNQFEIKGESYSDDAYHFYKPIVRWLRNYLDLNEKPLTLDFHLVYFNTSSSSIFFQIFEMLENYTTQREIPVEVNWYARPEDMDILEEGEDFQEDFQELRLNVSYQQIA